MKEITDDIRSKIHNIRGMQVMMDKDLAELYGVATGNLNKAVKRNIDRFPEDFMFQLTKKELESLIFQFGISNRGGVRKLPYVFTEQGVATLSGILRSKTAIEVNIRIMRAFVEMRRFIATNAQVFMRLDSVERKQIEHDRKFDEVFRAIEARGVKPEKGIFFEGQVFDADAVRMLDKLRASPKKLL